MNAFSKICFLLGCLLVLPFVQAQESILLRVEEAQLKGCNIQLINGIPNIGYLDQEGDEVVWEFDISESGLYSVEMDFSISKEEARGGLFEIKGGISSFRMDNVVTGDHWDSFIKKVEGKLYFPLGRNTFSVKALRNKGINIRSVRLIPVPKMCYPNKYGIIDGGIEKAQLSHLNVYQKDGGAFVSINWDYSDSGALWKIKIPEAGRYAIELSWANDDPRRTLEVRLNSQTVFCWKIERTGFWGQSGWASSKIIGELNLPAGESELSLYIADAEQAGNLDCRGIRLIPVKDFQAKEGELKRRPRLGMNLYELEFLWGKSAPRKDIHIERRGDHSDVDWDLYEGLAKQVESREWMVNGMHITAIFLKDVCIGLDFNRSTADMMDIASVVLPGVSWNYVKGEKMPQTIYSKDKNYKMQAWKEGWGDYFEIKASGLVRALRASELKKLSELRKRPCLGMTEEELTFIWGSPVGQEWPAGGIQRRGDRNDVDWLLYEQIKPQCSVRNWKLPNRGNLAVNAYFWKNICIGLDINVDNRILSPREIITLVQSFVPSVRFVDLPVKRGIPFTVYSSNYGGGYKLQNWVEGGWDYFEIKASGLIREMKEVHILKLKKSVRIISDILKTCDRLNNGILFGITWQDMDKLLGTSEMCTSWWCGKPSRIWKFPNSDISIVGSFWQDERGNGILHDITLVDEKRELNPEIALLLCKRLISPYQLENVSKDQLKSWFTVRSSDPEKRFIVEWYQDGSYGASLRISDDLPRQKQEEKKRKRDLNEIKDVL